VSTLVTRLGGAAGEHPFAVPENARLRVLRRQIVRSRGKIGDAEISLVVGAGASGGRHSALPTRVKHSHQLNLCARKGITIYIGYAPKNHALWG
jgi:hypothetical protein